jgi:hypothetical protein
MQDQDDDPDQQDEELHGNLEQSIEQQAQATVADRTSRQVSLNLRLIGAEVGHRQEETAGEARPEGVAVVEVEGEIDRVHLPHRPCDAKGIEERDLWRQNPQEPEEDEGESADHDHNEDR